MAGRMSSEFAQLLEQRKLFRSRIARVLAHNIWHIVEVYLRWG